MALLIEQRAAEFNEAWNFSSRSRRSGNSHALAFGCWCLCEQCRGKKERHQERSNRDARGFHLIPPWQKKLETWKILDIAEPGYSFPKAMGQRGNDLRAGF